MPLHFFGPEQLKRDITMGDVRVEGICMVRYSGTAVEEGRSHRTPMMVFRSSVIDPLHSTMSASKRWFRRRSQYDSRITTEGSGIHIFGTR